MIVDVDSPEYARFIMPTTEELAYEEWFSRLPKEEQQLEILHNEFILGKCTWEQYELAVDMELFYSDLPDERQMELYHRYIGYDD